MQKVSENVYRSPAGVVIRTRRRGDDWEVAEVVFDGPAQVKREGDGKIKLKIGDVVIDYSAVAGRFRAVHRKAPSK